MIFYLFLQLYKNCELFYTPYYKNYCAMNYHQFLESFIETDSDTRTQKIRTMKDAMLNKMEQIQSQEKNHNKIQQKKMFQAFLKLLQKISTEVIEAKQRYEKADKQQLRQNKLIEIAQEINFFRECCHVYKNNLKDIKNKIKDQRNKRNGLQAENSAIKKASRSKIYSLNASQIYSKLNTSARYGQYTNKQQIDNMIKNKQTSLMKKSIKNRQSLQLQSAQPKHKKIHIQQAQLKQQKTDRLKSNMRTHKNAKRSLNLYVQQI